MCMMKKFDMNVLDIEKPESSNGRCVLDTDTTLRISEIMAGKFNKELTAIEELLSKRFNANISISILPEAGMNAFTIPLHNIVPLYDKIANFKIVKDKYGYRLKKEASPRSMFIFLYPDMFKYDPEMTMAIIMHEVGHNFYKTSFITEIFIAPRIVAMLLTEFLNLIGFVASMVVSRLLSGFLNRFAFFRWLALVISIANYSTGKLFMTATAFFVALGVFNPAFTIGMVSVILASGAALTPARLLDLFCEGFHNERFADDFATANGYGVGSAKFDAVMMTTGGGSDPFSGSLGLSNSSIKGLRKADSFILFRLVRLIYAYTIDLANIFECHPDTAGRMRDVIELYEEDIKDNPHQEKALRIELEYLKKLQAASIAGSKKTKLVGESKLGQWSDKLKGLFASLHGRRIEDIEADIIAEKGK